ncbi:MAG TPA: hypothetical protein VM510_11500 [Caulifigura sp.]|nr:hypothetical protein [Caulifigura sp.]
MGKFILLCGRQPETLRRSGPRGESRPSTIGPLQFYDPASGLMTRQCFTADDEILALILKPREIAIVLQDDRISAIALEGEKTLCHLTHCDADSRFVFAEGGRIVVSHRGRIATAFDLERGEELWSRDFVTQLNGGASAGCEIINLRAADQGSFQNWNARTGKPDLRFADASAPIAISGDGSRFAVHDHARCRVFDSTRQKDLCRVPMVRQGNQAISAALDDAGRRLLLRRRGPGVDKYDLWDCETGVELEVPPGISSDLGALSSDMRWAVRSESIPTFAEQLVKMLPTDWGQRLQKSKIFWDIIVRANRSSSHWVHLADVATNHELGRYEVPNFAEWMMAVDAERGAAAFGDRESILCYAIPSGRNWVWLAMWAIGPPVIVVVVRKLWRRAGMSWRIARRADQDSFGIDQGLVSSASLKDSISSTI